MTSWLPSRWWRVSSFAVLVGCAAVGWFVYHTRVNDVPQALFQECATQVGLTWRMNFLSNEQGEKFKINLYDHGCGVAVGDFDGDGHDDIYFCNQLGKNALYRNKGDGTFEDVTEKAGVGLGDRVCVAATFADYDNDGHPDLFVTSTRGGNVLFHNNGDGTFTDVTKAAGLTHVGHSQTAVFFDYDNDGRLDLFLTDTAGWTSEHYDTVYRHYTGKEKLGDVFRSRKEHNVLYHNNGDGTFTDVTRKAGLQGRGWAGDAVAFDFDGDGRMDLFVTSMAGRCQLFRNNGDGTFSDVTLKVLGRTPWGALAARLLDLGNGQLSLYVVDMHSDMWMGLDWDHNSLNTALRMEKKKFSSRYGPFGLPDAAAVERERDFAQLMDYRSEEVLYGNACYRNDGGTFTEVSDSAGLETFWPWGIATGDFDNDGFEDVFLPSGMGFPYYYWPNALLMNQGDGTFRDRALELGIEPPPRGQAFPKLVAGRRSFRSSRCAAVADFDGDGRLEIVVNNFNDQPYYFKNHMPANNWVGFRLQGTRSNRDAVGAVVRLYQGSRIMTRQVQGACGYLSQSSPELHFGLGAGAEIDHVEITWPSGVVQKLEHVAPNHVHYLVEPYRPR